MYNPYERAEKLRKAIKKKLKEDDEYKKKMKKINKKNVEKRWKKYE